MLVVIKGGGDLATGIAHRLKMSGFKVVITEIERPTVIRHTVAFASAVYKGQVEVEGLKAILCKDRGEVNKVLDQGHIPVVIDPEASIIKELKPYVVVDAIIAKRNLGTSIGDGRIVIGVGPGFEAGKDVHYVIESKRGHYVGKVLDKGSAIANTGLPGNIGGYTKERIIRAPKEGIFKGKVNIGDVVEKGDIVGFVDETPILAQMPGIIRGMLIGQMEVTVNFKCGDIDPTCELDHCFTISDKARAIGGGVLEAIMRGGYDCE